MSDARRITNPTQREYSQTEVAEAVPIWPRPRHYREDVMPWVVVINNPRNSKIAVSDRVISARCLNFSNKFVITVSDTLPGFVTISVR
jgi:hypothetical protein